MSRWIYVVLHLLFEGQSARHDARIRFLLAQIDILRSKLDGNRVIPSPSDRARLLAIGKQLGHDVKDIIGIVKPETYSTLVPSEGSQCETEAAWTPPDQCRTTPNHNDFNLKTQIYRVCR